MPLPYFVPKGPVQELQNIGSHRELQREKRRSYFREIMPFCCKTSTTWTQNLQVGQEYRQYTVQLIRQIGFCCETYRLIVNNEEIEDHRLAYNPCSPLCCPGGQFQFEQDGHTFLVIYNSLSWTNSFGGFRLFIDGVDVNTRREFSAFWRRRGCQIVAVGLVAMIVGIVLALVFHYGIKGGRWYLMFIAYSLFLTGVSYLILGIIPVLKYRRSSHDHPSAAVKYTASETV